LTLQEPKVPKLPSGGTSSWIKFLVGGLCLLVDFVSKDWARSALDTVGEMPFIPGFLRFNLVTNTGAAFNLGSGHAIVMTVLATAVTLVLIFWVLKEERKAAVSRLLINVGAGFLIGGALGNLADRFMRGRVTDFIEFAFFRFPVFNCADVCIDVGVGLLIIAAWRNRRTGKADGTPSSPSSPPSPSSSSPSSDQTI
jgi:signal peptidase II